MTPQNSPPDHREFSPSAGRNKAVIAQHLAQYLPQSAHLLEIASGTGEHGAALTACRPDISWQYSEYDIARFDSLKAWAAYNDGPLQCETPIDSDLLNSDLPKTELPNPDMLNRSSPDGVMHKKAGLYAPIQLDMCDQAWADNIGVFDAIFCANMIHIAPWPATLGLARGARTSLKRQGTVFLYGPFLEGQASIASNIAFSTRLKAQNPDWGVRSIDSVKHIFAKQGFNQISRCDLPANNLLLGFSR